MIPSSPSVRLRELLAEPGPSQIMGVYDGLSARIAAATGFGAAWASGLCMSTAMGVRDCSEASWSDVLALVSRIVDTVDLPVLVDGDTGYGNFNTARRFVVHAERIGAAGVCLEDKVFPKTNSFLDNGQELTPIDEFCGKIEACRDALRDPDFVLVARIEALVAGAGVDEALNRAEAYRQAGADAIFIHSNQPTVEEIREFMGAWVQPLPVVVSPTTYYRTTTQVYAELGIAALIWANQGMRAALTAMRCASRLLRVEGPMPVEPWIASLDELFGLMDYAQLAKDEEQYG
jgi:phosphoenolpyruvate phosphomutase